MTSHVGDLLAAMLEDYEVSHVFGQPGGQTVALYDGISRTRIRHVLVRDERSGGYAADAFARLTGRPGVCDVTVGPGTTKLADGLVESYNASIPVIALVGELPSDWASLRQMGVASQGFDQVPFLSAITKATLPVPSVNALPHLVRSAFRIATSGRPGPVALVIPHDVLDADWPLDARRPDVDDRTVSVPAFRTEADPETMRDAVAVLDAAARPVIIAGGGVHSSQATTELAALADLIDAVVVTSFTGKGAVAETGPLAAGVLNPLGPTASLDLARRADVVFWCGCKVGQNTSHNWQLPLPGQITIQLDIDPAELGRTFRPSVALSGDARTTLAALARMVQKRRRRSWRTEIARTVRAAAAIRAEEEATGSIPVAPQRAMAELAGRLLATDVVISDASFSAGWIAAHLPARAPGRNFLFARGQGGLGYAVPAAIGAAQARPEDTIVTVSGDGGFSYAIGELATHAQLGTRSVHVVLNNGTLGWLAMWQNIFFGGLRQSVDLEGLGSTPSFAAAARGLGCAGFLVQEPGELGDALDAAFAAGGPAVVEIRVDPAATPIHSYRRRMAEGGSHPRPGTVYHVPEWRRSPPTVAGSGGGATGR